MTLGHWAMRLVRPIVFLWQYTMHRRVDSGGTQPSHES